MGKIQVLDDLIANQIAAGEVVERPSSVVKELVENSIDAGSTRIDVEVEEGGLQLIRIADNGSGIDGEDLEIAFQRHATSKIASGKDLFRIRTLGFRGEALPSIAAVSKVECVTSTELSGLGRKLLIEGGGVRSVEETAAPKGTDIRVRELFFNTPARLKYMKSIQTELGHVSDYMYRLALAHPDIAFTLKHNGNVLLQTLGNGDLLQVIAAIYGTAAAKQMIPVEGESPDYTIKGYVSKPELTRSNRLAVSFIINGRYIRNFVLAQALLKAYHTLLPVNRYPLAALHIRMEPVLLDVNVHPSKLEVRFSKEAELVQLLEQTVKEALGRQQHIPKAGKSAPAKPAVVQEQLELYRPAPAGDRPAQAAAQTREQPFPPPASSERVSYSSGLKAFVPELPPTPTNLPNIAHPAAPSISEPPAERSTPPSGGASGPSPAARSASGTRYASAVPGPKQSAQGGKLLKAMEQGIDDPAPKLPPFPQLDPIGQVHGTYIVAQNEEGLFLIDQHAAHERIHYEYYYEQFGKPESASQQLLVPITLEFTPSDAELLTSRLPILAQAGVHLEAFGGNSFIVRAYPHWLPAGEEQAIIEEMTEWVLAEKKSIDLARFREKWSILCSCKASVKANQNLNKLEMEALLDRLAACSIPYTCPHGRPIVISFSKHELEKMFKRVM